MEPIIGITGNMTDLDNDFFPEPLNVNYSPGDLSRAVTAAGGIPVIIPINKPEMIKKYAGIIDGLILSGGQDVSPHLYGEEQRPVTKVLSPDRDTAETALIEAMLPTGKPILGICRGLQLLNTHFGGTLHQDLTENENIFIQHIQDIPSSSPTHKIKVNPNSYMGGFLPEDYIVNSLHHQVIRDLGEGLKATAIADDGVVEAFEAMEDDQNIVAVQWHPESSFATDDYSLAFFEDLVKRAKDYSK